MVRIITDSAADFEPVELERMNIACIPLSVLIDGKEYRENLDITKNQYYELLAQTKEFPKTSQPAPHLLKDLFEDAAANGDEAIFITLSSGLSGTYQSSVMIKNELGFENCYVVDSLNGTGGERMVVEYAVRLRDEGKLGFKSGEGFRKWTPEQIAESNAALNEYLVRMLKNN